MALSHVSPTTRVVATGIGAALFFVLGRFAAIPTPVPNTTINLQYAVLAVFALLYGAVPGALIGLIGHLLVDLTTYGPWWSWIITSAIVGLVLGLGLRGVDPGDGEFGKGRITRFIAWALGAHLVGWVLVAPTLDVLFYGEPANKVFTQGIVAFVANGLTTAVLGTIIAVLYARSRTRTGSLTAEQ